MGRVVLGVLAVVAQLKMVRMLFADLWTSPSVTGAFEALSACHMVLHLELKPE